METKNTNPQNPAKLQNLAQQVSSEKEKIKQISFESIVANFNSASNSIDFIQKRISSEFGVINATNQGQEELQKQFDRLSDIQFKIEQEYANFQCIIKKYFEVK